MKGELEQEFDSASEVIIGKRKHSAFRWYLMRLSMAMARYTPDDKVASVIRKGNTPFVGGLFQYVYDAKTKEKLPYWDAFPIVIPIEFYDDGFLGLNLHYMPPNIRVKILDKLMSYTKTIRTGSNGKRTYMRLSYQMLKGLYHIPGFDFMLKRYLYTHIKSRIMQVQPNYWREVAYLPTQQFKKASEEQVWQDARRHIKKAKKR